MLSKISVLSKTFENHLKGEIKLTASNQLRYSIINKCQRTTNQLHHAFKTNTEKLLLPLILLDTHAPLPLQKKLYPD